MHSKNLPEKTSDRFFCTRSRRNAAGTALQKAAFFHRFPGSYDSVNGSGDNAARITGTFSYREEAGYRFGFTGFVSQDADRGRRTCFRSGEDRVRHSKTGQLGIHGTDAFLQVFSDKGRENSAKIRRSDSRSVGRLYFPEGSCGPVHEKILHPLTGRTETAVSGKIRGFFDLSLQDHAGKRMIVPEIVRTDSYEEGGIAVISIPGMKTHTVHYDASGLGSSGNYVPARTHAESINSPAVRRMTDKFVRCRSERGMAGKGTILGLIDKQPRMFYPHAHCKGFL